MRALIAILAVGLLVGAADARFSWHLDGAAVRHLLQAAVAPAATVPAATVAAMPAATGGAATAPAAGTAAAGAAAAQPAAGAAPADPAAGAAAAQPAATGAVPAAGDAGAAAQPAATTAAAPLQPAAGAAPVQPAAGDAGAAVAAPQPAAGDAGAAAAQPAAGDAAPATAAENKVLRPGVYVIEDPPPPPPPAPVNRTAAAANVTGPPKPAAGKNLMVVMTVMGQEAKDIYKNQAALKQQVATAAGVNPSQVLWYNQTANQDKRTGVTAMSLVLNVDCTTEAECAKAGSTLYNTSSQTRLTDNLARSGVSLLPGTFQIYGVNSVGRYKGNDTLYENKALLQPATVAKGDALDYKSAMARASERPVGAANGTAAAPGALPLGNFTIPGFTIENTTTAASTLMPNLNVTSMGGAMGNGSLGGIPEMPGLQTPGGGSEPVEAEPRKAKSGAGALRAAAVPVLAAAAAAFALL